MLFWVLVEVCCIPSQNPAPRSLRRRSDQFQKNITKRGTIDNTPKEPEGSNLGPVVIGLFLFVVVGSGECQRAKKCLQCLFVEGYLSTSILLVLLLKLQENSLLCGLVRLVRRMFIEL